MYAVYVCYGVLGYIRQKWEKQYWRKSVHPYLGRSMRRQAARMPKKKNLNFLNHESPLYG